MRRPRQFQIKSFQMDIQPQNLQCRWEIGRTLDWMMFSDVEAQQMRSDQGGAVSPSILKAPVTPIAEIASGDEDVEIPSSSHKHLSSIPLTDNCAKMQTMDGGPVVAPKSKAARTDGGVKQVAEVETCQKCIRNIQRSP